MLTQKQRMLTLYVPIKKNAYAKPPYDEDWYKDKILFA